MSHLYAIGKELNSKHLDANSDCCASDRDIAAAFPRNHLIFAIAY